jgi:hypothetical protein
MRYAHNQHVHEMRDLLIEFGAANGEAELERWEDRLNIDRFEPKFMREFHRSAVLFRIVFRTRSACCVLKWLHRSRAKLNRPLALFR